MYMRHDNIFLLYKTLSLLSMVISVAYPLDVYCDSLIMCILIGQQKDVWYYSTNECTKVQNPPPHEFTPLWADRPMATQLTPLTTKSNQIKS